MAAITHKVQPLRCAQKKTYEGSQASLKRICLCSTSNAPQSTRVRARIAHECDSFTRYGLLARRSSGSRKPKVPLRHLSLPISLAVIKRNSAADSGCDEVFSNRLQRRDRDGITPFFPGARNRQILTSHNCFRQMQRGGEFVLVANEECATIRPGFL